MVYQDPKDIANGVTPAKRGELDYECSATTVPRALSIAKKAISEAHEVPARDLVILDVVREKSPLWDEEV